MTPPLRLAGAAVLALGVLGWWLWPGPFARSEHIPTTVARRGRFVHRVSAEGFLRETESTTIAVPVQATEGLKVAWIVADGQRVAAGDLVVRFDPTEIEKRLADGLADRSAALSKMAKSEARSGSELRKLEGDAGLAIRELDASRMFGGKDPQVYSRIAILEAQIDEGLALEKERSARAAQGTRASLARAELDLLTIEKRKADLKVDEARAVEGALEVRAPHDGVVLLERDWRGNVTTVGTQAWSGQPVARIPRLEQMEAEVFVLEADGGGLAPGKEALVRIEAHPENEVKGKISRLDNLAKPRVRGSPVQYFAVVLELEQTNPAWMKPGSRVQATIRVEDQDGALLLPRNAVFDRKGEKIVYARRGGAFEPVAVRLASTSLAHVVVAAGLVDGDVVALRDPTDAAVRTPAPAAGAAEPARVSVGGGA